MTIEFSLRRRATQARYIGLCSLSVAVVILLAVYSTLPTTAEKIVNVSERVGVSRSADSAATAAPDRHPTQERMDYSGPFVIITITLGLSAVSFACYLLGRLAMEQYDVALRLNGCADALSIAGGDVAAFERAAAILVPRERKRSSTAMISSKDLQAISELVKQLK